MMAEGSKVRLVRCPKCGNLLPELPDYPVYQCGGCDTLLKAKKKVIGSDAFSEKPGNERDGEGVEKLEYLSEKESVSLATESEVERESDGVVNARRKERLVRESSAGLVNSSSSKAEKLEMLVGNMSRIVVEKKMGYQSGSENIGQKIGKYRQPLKPPIDGHVEPDVSDRNMNGLESSVNSSRGKRIGEALNQFKDYAGSVRSREPARWDFYASGRGGSYGDGRTPHESRKLPMFAHSDEGSSNYSLASTSGGNGESIRNYNDPNISKGITYSAQDRAELLQKLDELKEQLSRYGVAEKQRYQDPVNHRRYSAYSSSIPPLAPDKHVLDTPYFKPYDHRRVPYENIHDAGMQKLHLPSNIPGYEDSIQPHIPRMHPHVPCPRIAPQPIAYFPRQYANFNQEPLPSYHSKYLFHQPMCSCFQCRNKKRLNPSHLAPAFFDGRKFPNEPADSNFKRQSDPVGFGPPYNPRANTPTLRSQKMELNAVRSGDTDKDIDGFQRRLPRKQAVPHGSVQLCYPIAGGAPFITCCNCFEPLALPKLFRAKEKFQQKIRCGACSKVFFLKSQNKSVLVSASLDNPHMSNKAFGESSDASKQVILTSAGHLNAGDTDYNFDGGNCDSGSAGFKKVTFREDLRPNTVEFEKRQQLPSSTSVSPEEEEKLHKLTGQSSELPSKDDRTLPLKDNPFECLNAVSSLNAIDRKGKENCISRMNQEKFMPDKITSRQNSVKDEPETEVEVSFSDYLNDNFSQDSPEVEAPSTTKKGTESLFVGFIKKSLREFSRSNQGLENERPSVFVNGQPISESMLKKAEKLAGPIHPGDYWYDRRGGFWGVMGHPCLGIIPPSIEEFNHPLPKNCAAGNTNIFVNGRELHQNDLELLTSRGLPTTSGKHYIVDISGQVIDEGSGEELNRLGRLAPTVEKMKRGFGMKVPRFLL